MWARAFLMVFREVLGGRHVRVDGNVGDAVQGSHRVHAMT